MDIIRNLYLHNYSHKMFYKTKSSSSRQSNSATVTTSQNGDQLRSQQFYIYSIDSSNRTPPGANVPPPYLDLPPRYEDVVKDPNYVRRDAVRDSISGSA